MVSAGITTWPSIAERAILRGKINMEIIGCVYHLRSVIVEVGTMIFNRSFTRIGDHIVRNEVESC